MAESALLLAAATVYSIVKRVLRP